MATVESLTKDRMLAIEAASVVDGEINGSGHLILTRFDGSTIDAGYALVAVPSASTTVSGVVELATSSETSALTDTTRAVTPASLSSLISGINSSISSGDAALDTRLDYLEGLPGSKVQIITAPAESAASTSYPTGISMCSVGSGSGWSLESGFGTIVTYNVSDSRCYQTFTSHGSSGQVRQYIRTYYNTFGWSAWAQVNIPRALTPASFSQSTSLSSYPQGNSRLYLSSTDSTAGGWDFSGKFGEVLTYRDGSDYAHQTWRKHQGGTASETELWMRTSNAANGWSNWRIIADDSSPTWISYTPTFSTGSLGNGTMVARYKLNGKTCHYTGILTLGSTTSFGGGALALSLPFARQGTVSIVGPAIFIDVSAGTGGYRVAAVLESGTTAMIFVFDGGAVFSTTPFTWATGDIVRWNLTYEIA